MQDEMNDSSSAVPPDIVDKLPLRLLKSEIIPPALNRVESGGQPAIDWLYDFAGCTWIAYGASSLLVISHFPNPLAESETLIGPILRQVFELSVDGTGIVSAVSWSPVTPSVGDLAAAVGNCIGLFSYNSEFTCNSSFCWSQSAMLVQSAKVEAIKWTLSGDGIITGGIEVVLWRRKEEFWERAWKFKPEVPHVLVSASWTIEGILATAPHSKFQVGDSSSRMNKASNCVLVTYGRDAKFLPAVLRHPSPISMIQWRPSTGRTSNKGASNPLRSVLLTGCLDGTVRLWSEIDDGRVRKSAKDTNENKMARLSFQVVAVIEVNQALYGTLGSDIFVRWAAEVDSITGIGHQCFSSNDHQHDKAGSCEWLIGFGPQLTVTLWAIHCLDNFSPLRFPRVTLWKKQELASPEVGKRGLVLDKVFIARNEVYSPPKLCSFVELLPCSSLAWLHMYSLTMPETEERSTDNQNTLSSPALGILDISSHSGKLLQVVVHPYLLGVELAASLDTDGMILFWHLSPGPSSFPGLPTLKPSCKLSGRTVFPESHHKYTSLGWAPAILNDNRVLIMGHAGGIDFFMAKDAENEEKIACQYLCTVPFCGEEFGQGPTNLCSVPLPSACNKSFVSDNFLLLAIWKHKFRALSWKMTIHQSDLPLDCSCAIRDTAENSFLVFETDFCGKRYQIYADRFSSTFLAADNKDKISSFSVLFPTNIVLSEEQKQTSANVFCSSHMPYHLVTGYQNGIIKLWRSVPEKLLSSEWELVGMLAAHHEPVVAISPSACGRRIATASLLDASSTSGTNTVCIWECVHIGSSGNFILEDTIYLGAEVISLNWLTVGNGQSLLGVCLLNELKIYGQRRFGGQSILKSKESFEGNLWVCIAETHTYPIIRDFFWGPRAMVGVVHLDYFCLFSHLSLLTNKNSLAKSSPENRKSISISDCHTGENLVPAIFTDYDVCNSKQSSAKDNSTECQSQFAMITDGGDNLLSIVDVEICREKYNSGSNCGLQSLLDVVGKLGGPISAFHPEALLFNISAGNWKRAYVALKNLVEHLASNKRSDKSYCLKRHTAIPQVPLSNYLEGIFSRSSGDGRFQWSGRIDDMLSSSQFQNGASQYAASWEHPASSNTISSPSIKSGTEDFLEAVGKLYDSGGITNDEKLQVHALINVLQEVSDPHSTSACGSLDEPGRRFWVAVKFQQQYFALRFGRSPLVGELVVSSGLIGWAFHSDCQENLFNSLLFNEASWEEMRDMGIGFWYTNTTQLRLKMEKLARQRYLKNKDPKACALLYIALNRLQVLAGLFKMSKDEKDKPLVGFLSRNFQEDKNKAAALKNAYVLMGKHQLELAIAFFLLGGDTSSAVTVCAKNLGDEQLALVICRLVEGYGGPLEQNLISKFILPSAISKGDYCLAAIFEWTLGNYHRAFLSMLGPQKNLLIKEPNNTNCQVSLLDPSIGQYCLMLATKTNLKNAIGEQHASFFGQWAIWMSTTALDRCGMPLEALECLSSSINIFGSSSRRSILDNGDIGLQNEVLKLFASGNSSNWISDDIASPIDYNAKLDLAMHYISILLKEHPSWGHINMEFFGASTNLEPANQEYKTSVVDFHAKLAAALLYFEQKFSLIPFHLINKIVLFFCGSGLEFIAYHILHDYASKFLLQENCQNFGGPVLHSLLPELLLKASEEISLVFSRYIAICSISCSKWKLCSSASNMCSRTRIQWLISWDLYLQILMWSLWNLRAMLKLYFVSSAEDFLNITSMVLDLAKYYTCFASAYIKMNVSDLAMLVTPLLIGCSQGDTPYEIIKDLKKLPFDMRKMLEHDLYYDNLVVLDQGNILSQHDLLSSVPADDRWKVVGWSLWGQVSSCLQHLLGSLPEKLEQSSSLPSRGKLPKLSTFSEFETDFNDEYLLLVSHSLSKLLKATCSHISGCCGRQFASYLVRKGDARTKAVIFSTEDGQHESTPLHNHLGQTVEIVNILKSKNELSPSEMLWLICADPKVICGLLLKENSKWFEHIKKKSLGGWHDMHVSILRECEVGGSSNEDDKIDSPKNTSPQACLSPSDHPFLSTGGRDAKKAVPFATSKEIYRRNGELLEALCINSIDQHQAALATNRKGIIFFNWEDGLPNDNGSEYLWAEADWPPNGWAGSQTTPVPTCVSPGVGLESRKGAHLGLGGATVGAGPLPRPGRDVMNGGAIGIPGYAGMGLSGLGWGIQEDFEQFSDPPPTVDSVRTSSFSTHPSRPLFLVGSSNTHIYLWEFGKDRATATYGVLPAPNVPPPYALASISAVRFDHYGHRFVTAALDGTVCTWQLEVGGRSNVRPTECSICFDNHTSDVTYITASGSIIAAAGYSSTGVNVVMWDTLAPAATSRASIMCHEGGARSLSVFDNNLGSGSVSPLIVTGGKGGDVGLHDFRYIATGRTKKHKQSDASFSNANTPAAIDMRSKSGDQNRNGMLWYIPKAHSGSVTRISTIPNTSFFLTGSKDGDVKLWDVKTTRLIYHWPKLHERHTFMQPSSRGFGGVFRAAVTDIQVVSNGFLTCGGDGSVKLVKLRDFAQI